MARGKRLVDWVCQTCGIGFEAPAKPERSFCSRRCYYQAKPATREPSTEPKIKFDRNPRTGRPWVRFRDQFKKTCEGICEIPECLYPGVPIWMDAPARHPLSWTLDHIVPLTYGGELLEPSNARHAHYGCNSSRSDGRKRIGRTWSINPTSSRDY